MAKPKFAWGKDFTDYLESLSNKDKARMLTLIQKVEQSDLQVSIRKKRVRKLNDELYELRIQTDEHWLRGCYFHIHNNEYYITHGFNKKTNKTPHIEINKAIRIRKAWYLNKEQEKDE